MTFAVRGFCRKGVPPLPYLGSPGRAATDHAIVLRYRDGSYIVRRRAFAGGRGERALLPPGRPYDPTRLLLARGLYVDESDATAWRVAGPAYTAFLDLAMSLARPAAEVAPSSIAANPFDTTDLADSVVFGSPDSCAAQLQRIRDIGVEYVLFFIRFADLDHARIVRSLERFAREVAPRFADDVVTAAGPTP